jgi:hypothetical protein
MVSGSRANLINGKTKDEGKPSKNGDLESGGPTRRRDPRNRFRDVIGSVIQDGRRNQMKKKLLDGLKTDDVEKFRKSQDDLKAIKNKKIRKYYEDQNERLNDWLEVDTLVRHLADDVLDSFDPQDVDGDGIPDDVGPLKNTENDIEPFLPQDEREKRAINVSCRSVPWSKHNTLGEEANFKMLDQCDSEYHPVGRKGFRSILFKFAIAYCVFDG